MQVLVKICGIRSFEAAQAAVDAGAHFLGFNFVPSSKRYINPKEALKIIKSIRGKMNKAPLRVKIVGVFQDTEIDYVNEMSANLGLDFVQLHGRENNDYINKVGVPAMKSVTLKDQLSKIKAKYFILDRTNRGRGRMVDFKKAARLAVKFPIFYAGGLNPENVADVINKVQPFAVDVAGGIETNGYQDTEKIKLFIGNAKGVQL